MCRTLSWKYSVQSKYAKTIYWNSIFKNLTIKWHGQILNVSTVCVLSSTGVAAQRSDIRLFRRYHRGQWPWYHVIWIALVWCRWWSWRLFPSSEAPIAAAAEISATARMTEDHPIFESIQAKSFVTYKVSCNGNQSLPFCKKWTILPGQELLPGSPVLPQLLLPVPQRSFKEEFNFWGWKVFPNIKSSCCSFQAEY